jgi:predicted PurR-regulated permease PerM
MPENSSALAKRTRKGMKRVWVHPLSTLFIAAVALAFFFFFFDAISTVALGVLAAAIVASTLDPLVGYVPGKRGIGAAVLGLSFILVVTGLVLSLSLPLAAPIKKKVAEWPQSRDKIEILLANWSDKLGVEKVTVEGVMTSVGRFFAGESGRHFFSRGADVVLSILIWLAFVFIGSIFILAETDGVLRPLMTVVSPTHRWKVEAMLANLGPRLRRWVIGTLLSMLIVFTASLIGYSIIGLEFALPLAMLAGLAEIVPTVGPACACIIAILLAATVSGGAALGVLLVYGVIQSIEAYVILPMIMRGAVHIHPAVTLFSVVLWGKLFGIPGLMLAIPINLTIASAVEFLYLRPRDARKIAK